MSNRFNRHRYTVYDAMEAAGHFDGNSANADSRDPVSGEGLYKGPVQFPKMFYHPKGEERILRPAEAQATLFGPKMVNEQREIIFEVAQNERDAKRLTAEGWHDHPGDAIAAREGKSPPPRSPMQTISEKDAEIERLKAKLASAGLDLDDEESAA